MTHLLSKFEYAVLVPMSEGRTLAFSESEMLVTLKGKSENVDLRDLEERHLIIEREPGSWCMTNAGDVAFKTWSAMYGDRWELERDV